MESEFRTKQIPTRMQGRTCDFWEYAQVDFSLGNKMKGTLESIQEGEIILLSKVIDMNYTNVGNNKQRN